MTRVQLFFHYPSWKRTNHVKFGGNLTFWKDCNTTFQFAAHYLRRTESFSHIHSHNNYMKLHAAFYFYTFNSTSPWQHNVTFVSFCRSPVCVSRPVQRIWHLCLPDSVWTQHESELFYIHLALPSTSLAETTRHGSQLEVSWSCSLKIYGGGGTPLFSETGVRDYCGRFKVHSSGRVLITVPLDWVFITLKNKKNTWNWM